MSVTRDDIEVALSQHCRRRARHLCKVYADEQYPNDKEDASLLYQSMQEEYGLANLD